METIYNNRLKLLLTTFLKLDQNMVMCVYINDFNVTIEPRSSYLNNFITNIIYIYYKEDNKDKYEADRLVLVISTNLDDIINNKIFLELMNSPIEFREKLINIIEKEILR